MGLVDIQSDFFAVNKLITTKLEIIFVFKSGFIKYSFKKNQIKSIEIIVYFSKL